MALEKEKEWVCSVYAISDGIGNVKFGVAKDIPCRMKSLQVGNAHPLQLLFSIDCTSPRRHGVASIAHLVEHHIHKAIQHKRMNGEWFAIDYHDAWRQMEESINAISQHHWTLRNDVTIDGVFVEREEEDHIWYWPTNDAHERGIAQ